MPNLAPRIQPKKLKDNWFRICSNPEEDDDENLCIQIIEGPFHHVVVKYKNFKLKSKLNEDGSINCDYEYDIITAPSTIGEHGLTDEEGEIFEKKLGESLLEILWETANNENRNSNTKEFITE